MRYAYVAVCLALLGALLCGCGGGGSATKATSRRAGKVVIKIVVPKRATQKGRIVPLNTQSIKVTYTAIDANGVVTPNTAVVHAVSNPTFNLTDVEAGANVPLNVSAYDQPNAAGTVLASGSTTINLQPGATAPVTTITLVSDMTSLTITSAPSFPLTIGQTITVTAVTAVPVDPSKLTWTALTSNLKLLTPPNAYAATFQAIKSGPASLQVVYTETGTASLTATLNGVVSPTVTYAGATPITITGGVNAPATGAFGLAGDNTVGGTVYALFNDSAFPISAGPPATAGASRIAPFTLTQQADVASFDPVFATTYSGTNSRLAFLPTSSLNPLVAWAVIDNTRQNITAFASGSNAATTVTRRWGPITPPVGFSAYGLDTETTTLLDILERNAGGSQVELRRQSDGSLAATLPLTAMPALFAPINLATLPRSDGTRDIYLANTTSVVKLTQNGVTLDSNFVLPTTPALTTPFGLATSDIDPTYLYVLDQVTNSVYILSATDGTLATTVALHGTVTVNSRISARQGWLYVLDTALGGAAQIERYQIGSQ